MSSNTTSAPTVVLVHGAWHGAWCWNKTVPALEAHGLSVVAPDMPGHGSDPGSLGDLAADAQRLRDVVGSIDGPVMLVGHSYGGLIISEAASDAATAAKVSRLVYLCAIATAPGQTFFGVPADHSRSLLGGLIRQGDDGLSTIDTSDFAAAKEAFYGDCDDADVAFAAANLSAQPMGNMAGAISGDPLATIPGTYIRCTEDRTIPIEVQDALVASVQSAAPSFETITLTASHSPFLSMPTELATHLAELALR
jgi:pimeloyl-ACP methyl ester carboxylesterase